ncbi:2-C-methyl-D-erythritol 4-phosphate cytidylyltransferase [Pollutibacter soli]|uniref:2-C-methyl-D-erythritol 4-phosphate cytidylyltransferase n=1 Tax=Pollutibacter soli TaxID=3034157 RepID=UPI003013556D
MKKFAVIVAGGSGTRMGSAIPKQFLEVRAKPILLHTVKAFIEAFQDIQIILVLPETYLESAKSIFENLTPSASLSFVKGGATRFDSVKNGLASVDEEGIVFIHDAVRCLVTPDLIKRCYQHAAINGSAIPVVPLRDSLRIIKTNGENEILDREIVRAVQTPQTFKTALIKEAFEQPYQTSFTDEASVLGSAGYQVSLLQGEETNIKVTFPADLIFAEHIMSVK